MQLVYLINRVNITWPAMTIYQRAPVRVTGRMKLILHVVILDLRGLGRRPNLLVIQKIKIKKNNMHALENSSKLDSMAIRSMEAPKELPGCCLGRRVGLMDCADHGAGPTAITSQDRNISATLV